MQPENVTFLSAPLTVEQHAALDKLDELGTCWRALTALMPGEQELDQHDRDAVAVLMQHLSGEYEAASAAFRKLTWHGLRPAPAGRPD